MVLRFCHDKDTITYILLQLLVQVVTAPHVGSKTSKASVVLLVHAVWRDW